MAGSRSSSTRHPSADEQMLLEIARQLGLENPPKSHLERIPLDRLKIPHPDKALKRRGMVMANQLRLLGQLAPIGVVKEESDTTDASTDAHDTYIVCFGRARTDGAGILFYEEQLPNWETIEARVFDLPANDMRVRSVLALAENLARTTPWVDQLRHLRDISADGYPINPKELARLLSIPRSTAISLFEIAFLPEAIIEQVYDGTISSRLLLHRITRLSSSQRDILAMRAEAGERINDVMVRETLHMQISRGFQSELFQAALSQSFTSAADEDEQNVATADEESPIPLSSASRKKIKGTTVSASPASDMSLRPLEAMLLEKLPVLRGRPDGRQAAALVQALLCEIGPLVKTEAFSQREAV